MTATGRKTIVSQHGIEAGALTQLADGSWQFSYQEGYSGEAVSLTMPVSGENYQFEQFPPTFEGLLPEGVQLEALLRKHKIDRHDAFAQLMAVGNDLVGSLTFSEQLEV